MRKATWTENARVKSIVLLFTLAAVGSCTGNNSPDISANSKKKTESSDQGASADKNNTTQKTNDQSRIQSPVVVPQVTPTPAPKLKPSVTPIVNVTPEPKSEAGTMSLNATLFVNMEKQKHATDGIAFLEVNNRAVAWGPISVLSATNGAALQGSNTGYSNSKIKIDLSQRDASLASGQGQLSICSINGVVDSSISSAKCIQDETTSDPERPTAWIRVPVSFTVTDDAINISNEPRGLTFSHIVYSAVQGGQVATNDDGSSPLVLDLNRNDKVDLNPVFSGKKAVLFDVLNLGFKVSTGWVKSSDGLLALDVNNDGMINNGSELFGEASYSVKPVGKFELSPFMDGFSALAQYDENKDSVIDSKDQIFNKILVWRDKNSNGISEKKELMTLDTAGIKEISLSKTMLGKAHQWPKVAGNEVRLEGNFVWKDGKKGKMFDVWFAQGEKGLAKK